MKKTMYSLPKYLAIVVALICVFFIAQALLYAGEPYSFSFVGNGGTFNSSDITIFGLSLYWVFILSGVVATILVAILRKEKYGFSTLAAILIAIGFFLQALLGAKILYGLEKVISTGGHWEFFSCQDSHCMELYLFLFY